MNDFSFQQVLDSIHEMRASLRGDEGLHSKSNWDDSTPFWEEGVCETPAWFEDCEFDPRGSQDE